MRVLKCIGAILLGLMILILLAAYAYLRSTLPDYDGEIKVSGIIDDIEIIRDAYGMPHIYAQTDEDVYFALGYCIAQDRLFQMDMVRRAAKGRLAEILGKDFVAVDTFFRTITAGKSCEDIAAAYPADMRAVLNAYAAGINYFLTHRKNPLPIEFTILDYTPDLWEPSDSVAVHYYMAWDLNTAFAIEMLHAAVIDKVGQKMADEIFIDYPEQYPSIIPSVNAASGFLRTQAYARKILGAEKGGVSNNWVVSAHKSITGKPILANDPHLGHGAPGIWYEAHLISPSMNVSGSVLPGLPFVIIGANEQVAWGLTNVMADDADFYIEKLNPANPNQYEFKGRWEDMQLKEELITVKGAEKLTFTIRLTRHGPIVDDVNDYTETKGTSLAMRWTAYEMLPANPFIMLSRAKSIDDIEQAVEHFKCPGQNWVYADRDGNIGYWAAVGIPMRGGFSGAVPVPGWDGNHEWKGYVPTHEQPHLRNPARGWIATANNKHVGGTYAYPISHYYTMPDRFVRIQEMISAKEKLDVNDFQRMQADYFMVIAKEWVPVIRKNLADAMLSKKEREAVAMLTDWDFVASADSVAPTIFHATVNCMIKNTFKNRLGNELYEHYIDNDDLVFNALRSLVAEGHSLWFNDPETSVEEGLGEMITNSFREAIAYLEQKMGAALDGWRWGKLHTLTLYHPFGKSSALMGYFMNIGPFPIGGSFATVNPQPYRLTAPWEGFHGASLRYIIDFSDMRNSRRVIPAGISGNFMSPHYDDQAELWRTGNYRAFVLDREEVEKDARYVLKMIPGM